MIDDLPSRETKGLMLRGYLDVKEACAVYGTRRELSVPGSLTSALTFYDRTPKVSTCAADSAFLVLLVRAPPHPLLRKYFYHFVPMQLAAALDR